MAQQDTGLGWSAKDTYLQQYSGLIDSASIIGGPDFPNQPLIPVTSGTDLLSQGIPITHKNSNNSDYYIGAYYDFTDVLFAWYMSNGTKQAALIRPGDNMCAILGAWVSATTGEIASGRIWQGSTAYNAAYNLTYMNLDVAAEDYTYQTVFNSLDEMLAAVQVVITNYYKLNRGYSVSVTAKWVTPAGDVIQSPVLISSNSEYVDISQDNIDPVAGQVIDSFLLDGIRFYMSYIPTLEKITNSVAISVDLTQFGAAYPQKVFALIANESFANILVTNSPDPYEEQDGASEEDGGDGEEIVDEPVLNDTHAVPTGGGFYKIFTPSLYQLGQLSQYMWGTLDIDNFKRIFSSPIDCILGLGIVPISLSGTSSPVYLGGIDTQLSFPRVTTEVYDFDMGYVHIKKATGSYLDYSPYTKISAYLPFIGFRELDTDDVMDTYLTLKYRIDIATGACIARLSRMGTTLYQFSGSCLKQLPITGTNWDNAITGAISTAVAIGSTVATAGASAPVLAGAVASASTQALTTKSSSQRSGSMSATSGLLGGVVPYIVRSTPIEVIPANQNRYIGYPSYTTQSLGSLTGYNEIASIHLEGIPATGDELAEIETLLKGGVIL